MRILIVDDEQMAREDLRDSLAELLPDAEIASCANYIDALAYCEKTKCDIAFLDIEMPKKNGLELAKEIKDIYPETNIIFVTGFQEYALDAFRVQASDYLLKPSRKADIERAIANLRQPVQYEEEKLRIQCFGNFEVFYKDKPVAFRHQKAKEILAYLVELRGAVATTDELCMILWEDDDESEKKKHYLRNLLAELKNTLKDIGVENVFIRKRNQFSINPSQMECDYYKYLEYDTAAVNSYSGVYMKQYSWAEMTNGFLERKHFEMR